MADMGRSKNTPPSSSLMISGYFLEDDDSEINAESFDFCALVSRSLIVSSILTMVNQTLANFGIGFGLN